MSPLNSTVAPYTNFDDSRIQQLFVAKTALLQAVDLLDNYLTSDEQLSVSSKFLPGSTIGAYDVTHTYHSLSLNAV